MEINEPFFFITTPAPPSQNRGLSPKIGGELRVVVGDPPGRPYKNRTPIKMILSTFFVLLSTILAFGSSTAWAVTISATGLTFGTLVAGGSGNATAVITVNAASGTPYTVTLDAGLNLTCCSSTFLTP